MEFKERAEELLNTEDYDNLIILAENEIKNNPNNVNAYLYKSYCIDDSSILDCYDKILELCPDNFDIHEKKMIYLYENEQNKEEIIKYCDNLIEKYSSSAEAYYTKATIMDYIYTGEPNFDNTVIIEICNKALEINPNLIKAYNLLGSLYQDNNEYAKALKYHQKASGIDEYNYDAQYNITVCLSELEGKKAAIGYCDKIIAKSPNNVIPYYVKFSYLCEDSVYYSEDRKNIENKFSKLIELDNNILKKREYYFDLAMFYEYTAEDDKAALGIYKKLLDNFNLNKDDRELYEDKVKKLQEELGVPLPIYTDGSTAESSNGKLGIVIFVIILFIAAIYYLKSGNILG